MTTRPPSEHAAHRYADAGWPVFPCRPGSKVPATEHGFHDAATSHRQITRWWSAQPEANLAIATGHPGPDVLDVDLKNGRSGYAALAQARRRAPVLPRHQPAQRHHPRRRPGLPRPRRIRPRPAVPLRRNRAALRGHLPPAQRRHRQLGGNPPAPHPGK